jgi:hypothetical protein
VLAPFKLDFLAFLEERDCPFEADAALVRRRVYPADIVPPDEAHRQVLQRSGFPASAEGGGGGGRGRKEGKPAGKKNSREVEGHCPPHKLVVAGHPFWSRMQEKDIFDERSVAQ